MLVGVMSELLLRVLLVSWELLVDGPHKCNKLLGNDPVQIAIFYFLIFFVVLDLEGPEVIPFEFNGILKPLQAMQQGALVVAVALRGVTIVLKKGKIITELLVSVFSLHFKYDDHETAHEESPVHHLVQLI